MKPLTKWLGMCLNGEVKELLFIEISLFGPGLRQAGRFVVRDEPSIWTHENPDLDAHLSCCAVRRFVPGMENAKIFYISGKWNGAGLRSKDIAVDLYAGGKGIKGHIDEDGTVHSSFDIIMRRYANHDEFRSLDGLRKFADCQDAHGSVLYYMKMNGMIDGTTHECRRMIAVTTITSVMHALILTHNGNHHRVFERLMEIFDGMLLKNRSAINGIRLQKISSYLNAWMYHRSGSAVRLSDEDECAMKDVIQFAEFDQKHGSVIKGLRETGMLRYISREARKIFESVNLSAILSALESYHSDRLEVVYDRMSEIFDGFVELHKANMRAEIEADHVKRFTNGRIDPMGKVALLVNKRESRTTQILWQRGVESVVYVDGLNLGIIRRDGAVTKDGDMFNADNQVITDIIRRAGETIGEGEVWFLHPKKHFISTGTRKAPATRRSSTSAMEFVVAISKVLR